MHLGLFVVDRLNCDMIISHIDIKLVCYYNSKCVLGSLVVDGLNCDMMISHIDIKLVGWYNSMDFSGHWIVALSEYCMGWLG